MGRGQRLAEEPGSQLRPHKDAGAEMLRSWALLGPAGLGCFSWMPEPGAFILGS